MELLKNIANAMSDAKDYVVEKNRRASLISKLKTTIKIEKMKADKAYIALGRYYFNNLRDESNPDTELSCVEIEEAESRVEKAAEHLEKIYKEDVVKKEEVSEDIVQETANKYEAENEISEGIIDEAIEPQEEDEIIED